MIAECSVKMFGKWYSAGDELPSPVASLDEVETVEPVEEVAEQLPTFNKTEINRMAVSDLRELAQKCGIDSEVSGAELKKLLIKHFGL